MTEPHVSSTTQSLPELLAPAGSMDALRAALDAGADAVYLGLASLNARRGAENFTPQTLPEAVRLAHDAGARVFLTLNILLTAREIGETARALELARSCGVDAVLIADPALLLFRPHYPELEFHFSTQAAITNSAGVLACAELGLRRAVLAREMNLAEILVATRCARDAGGAETEVFIQGALCLCVSGRCLLSSWGGGRSGNRGACTSPCRVRWNVDGSDAGTPLSMHDLCALEHLPNLIDAGVRCLKIEGRLKNADWVRQAVSLYRHALEQHAVRPGADAPADDREAMPRLSPERSDEGNRGASSDGGGEQMHRTDHADLRAAARKLAAYSGRDLTAAYLTGQPAAMTGESGRPAGELDSQSAPASTTSAATNAAAGHNADDNQSALSFLLQTEGARLVCVLKVGDEDYRWELTKSVVHNPARAITAQQLADWLLTQRWQNRALQTCGCDEPHALLPKKTANDIADEIAAILHRRNKATAAQPKRIEIPLPAEVRALTNPPVRDTKNDRQLGHKANMARLSCRQAATFLSIHTPEAVVVDGIVEQALQTICDTDHADKTALAHPSIAQPGATCHLERLNADDPFGLEALRAAVRTSKLILALPAVLFEDALPVAVALAQACARHNLPLEVNGWDGWHIARAAGAALWGGPGLPVLNPHAGLALQGLGFATAHYSPEAGARQLEEIAQRMPLPATLCVYGRPVLAYTRAGLPPALKNGAIIEDARKIRLRVERICGLTRLRTVEPFNIAHQANDRIRARWLCADLCGSQDPAAEWTRLRQPSKAPNLFNFERGLH